MRPVNLLPEGQRPTAPATPVKGGAYAVLGVLGALVIATFAYVTTTNQISSRTSDIDQARTEIAAAQARTGALGPFQAFAQVKETRLASVRDLAQARFDWERFMRELALVLPDGSSVSEVTASAAGAEDGAAASTTPVAPTAEGGSPTATLTGCATGQREVAVMLVRLRQLHRAADVQLSSSARQDDGASSGTGSTDSTAEAGSCGPGGYVFDATVSFGPEVPDPERDAERAPARLGGGS